MQVSKATAVDDRKAVRAMKENPKKATVRDINSLHRASQKHELNGQARWRWKVAGAGMTTSGTASLIFID